ncbi:DNA helicase [Tanacetum coccineum]|uniref:ATP-dependent DNA helicase n=1 Tax=Tanacetum coccineum TaxID=301880 RepID=A0ABQ5EC59_9ASTR
MELISTSIAESHLWCHFKVLSMTQNMRLQRPRMDEDERKRTEVFATWLLNLGNDECGEPDEDDNVDTSWITIPSEYYVSPDEKGITELINFIYDAETLKNPTAVTLKQKTIVSSRETSETKMLYPMEYLNTMQFPGFPPHEFQLKVGSPIMFLWNVNLSKGLCNGTRMKFRCPMSKVLTKDDRNQHCYTETRRTNVGIY